MAIKELKPKQGNADVTAEVIEKGEIREFNKFGKQGRVCNAKIKDDTGEIALTLWNEQIEQVNVGDTIHLTNGYVNEWQGEMQLTSGKFGKIEVVGKGDAKASPNDLKTDKGSHILTKDEVTEEEALEEESINQPSPAEAETKDEETESEVLEEDESKESGAEESETEDEISIEEEEIK